MALLLKGGPVAEAMSQRLLDQCAALKNAGVTPVFTIVRVGEKANDIAYERGAAKRAGLLGVEVRHVVLPESTTEDQLVQTLEQVNEDDSVHGCLLFRPLPAHLDTARVARTLKADKDVDAMTSSAMGVLLSPNAIGYAPCTAQASLEILKYYQIPLQGKRITVIGKSMTVGLPTALLMMNEEATVSVCHILSRPEDTRALCKDADIIISAAGAAGVIDRAHLGRGQTIVDIGLSPGPDGELLGDVDFDAAEPLAAALTPKKGGVGAVTTAVLMAHTVEAAMRKCGLEE